MLLFTKKHKGLGAGFLVLACLLFPLFSFSKTASLYFSPNSGTFFVGSTFEVSVLLNTGDHQVNAVRVSLKFDPKKLQVASPVSGKSFISVWVAQPSYSNADGRVSFQGGMPSPGINTSAGLVATIVFRAISPGETTISCLDSSQALLNDGLGTNILTSLGKASYTLSIVPPEGPLVSSATHPDQNKWYKDNNPSFNWEKEEEVTDFSYLLNRDFDSAPDNISEGGHNAASFSKIDDGLWYFHVKAKKRGVWGGSSHYPIRIDATPPASFPLVFNSVLKEPSVVSSEPIVSFITTDALSGIDHFEIKTIDLINSPEEAGFFIEINSPYKLSQLQQGEHLVVIRAYDKAMNWQESSAKIEIKPSGVVSLVGRKGVGLGRFFIPWPVLFLFLSLLLLLIAGLIFCWWRGQRRLQQKQSTIGVLKGRIGEKEREFKNRLSNYEQDRQPKY